MMMTTTDGGDDYNGNAENALQIVILQFKSSNRAWLSWTSSVCPTLCNAMQEPSLVHNGNFGILGEVFKHYANDDEPRTRKGRDCDEIDNMFNVTVRVGILPGDPVSSTPLLIPSAIPASPSLKGQRSIKSGKTIYKFWDGIDGINGADESNLECRHTSS